MNEQFDGKLACYNRNWFHGGSNTKRWLIIEMDSVLCNKCYSNYRSSGLEVSWRIRGEKKLKNLQYWTTGTNAQLSPLLTEIMSSENEGGSWQTLRSRHPAILDSAI